MPNSTIPHFLQARCPSWCPTYSAKALKATVHTEKPNTHIHKLTYGEQTNWQSRSKRGVNFDLMWVTHGAFMVAAASIWNSLPHHITSVSILPVFIKGKGFPYSIPSVGPGADPGVQAVSLQVTVSHPPGGRLPLLSARPVVTFPATQHQGTKLYCLVTDAHRCEQLAQGCYAALPWVRFEPATYRSQTKTMSNEETWNNKNSSDEIENVNFHAVRPEATRIWWNNAK